jgi:hypothetical protein
MAKSKYCSGEIDISLVAVHSNAPRFGSVDIQAEL